MEERELISGAIAVLLRNGYAVLRRRNAIAPKDGKFLLFTNINSGMCEQPIADRDQAICAFLELCQKPNLGAET